MAAGVLLFKIPAVSANLRAGNHDVHKSNNIGGVYQDENNWRGDESQQSSHEKDDFGGFSKRNFWPVPFQLFSPIVLKSLVGDKESNYGGEHRKLGRQFLRLQKRNTQPNTLELISPTLKIYLGKWLSEDNAKTIKRNQEPTSYLSYCYIYMGQFPQDGENVCLMAFFLKK